MYCTLLINVLTNVMCLFPFRISTVCESKQTPVSNLIRAEGSVHIPYQPSRLSEETGWTWGPKPPCRPCPRWRWALRTSRGPWWRHCTWTRTGWSSARWPAPRFQTPGQWRSTRTCPRHPAVPWRAHAHRVSDAASMEYSKYAEGRTHCKRPLASLLGVTHSLLWLCQTKKKRISTLISQWNHCPPSMKSRQTLTCRATLHFSQHTLNAISSVAEKKKLNHVYLVNVI